MIGSRVRQEGKEFGFLMGYKIVGKKWDVRF
jgi:hypothetical protein